MPSGGKRSTAWKPGTSPKKKKGTKHKTTLLKEAFGVKNWDNLKEFVEGRGVEKLTSKMERLRPAQYAMVFLALCEFVKPKLQRTTHAGDKDNPVVTETTHTVVFKKYGQ